MRFGNLGAGANAPAPLTVDRYCDGGRVDLSRRCKSGIMVDEGRQKLMKTLDEIRRILEAQREYLATNYGVTVIGVFGSYVRGEQGRDSG